MEVIDKTKLIDFGDIDTKDFCRAGLYYEKHKEYPKDPDWWDEEDRRMKDGFQVGDWKITGEHYTYQNFCRIKITDDDTKYSTKKTKRKKAVRKREQPPDFWDGDYVFYWCKYIARWGLTEEEYLVLKLPIKIKVEEETNEDGSISRFVGGGKNLCVGKKRRFGASYKLSNSAARNYILYPKSLTVLCAYDNAYLLDDAIMSKVKANIDFFDAKTAFGGRRLINTDDDVQMGYKEKIHGVEVEDGNLSRVMAISYGKNKSAVRGKDAEEIFAEESGKSPNLLEMTAATMDTMGDGDFVTGQIIWFGTGGGDNTDWDGFKEIFFNPQKYNALEIENQWSDNALGTYCGLFIPDYWNYVGRVSENGESYINWARQTEEEHQYDTYIVKGDMKGLVERKMEHPFTPEDAFAITSNNIFDVAAIREWRTYLERTGLYKSVGNIGRFVVDEHGKLKFTLDNTLSPYWAYPVKKGTDTSGAVCIWQSPIKIDGKVPNNLYGITVDTYRHDTTTGDSVGAIYVWLFPNNIVFNGTDDKLVASFIGRPRTQEEFNRILFQLGDYYNAKIAFENDEPGGIVDFAKTHKKLDRLQEQFELAFDAKIATGSNMNRKYGIHMGSGKDNLRKQQGDIYLKEWLETVRSVTEEGVVLNLHTIFDIGLLLELENYAADKNCDRVSSARIYPYFNRELIYKQIKAKVPPRTGRGGGFFNTRHFQ